MITTHPTLIRSSILLAVAWLGAAPWQVAVAAEICQSKAADGSVSFSDCKANKSATQTRLQIEATDQNFYDPSKSLPAQTADESPATPGPVAMPLEKPTIPPAKQAPTPEFAIPSAAELTRLLSSSLRKDKQRIQPLQDALDASCEDAREALLAPERTAIVQECLQSNFDRSEQQCLRFAKNHGAATAQRGPLYYELAECERAFEFDKARRALRNSN